MVQGENPSGRTLFFYGTLRDPDFLAIILGWPISKVKGEPATLSGYAVFSGSNQGCPSLVAQPNETVQGILVPGLSETDIARLSFYEGPQLYALASINVEVSGERVATEVFTLIDDRKGQEMPWVFQDWRDQDQGITTEAALEMMDYFNHRSDIEVMEHYPGMRARAQGKITARDTSPVELRRGFDRDNDVQDSDLRRPYLGFFAVEERRVSFRKLDGNYSAPVDRAIFLSVDAVTVLPYDPITDRVLLIEQFRAGAYSRGDQSPWCLEAIAGRRDPGETCEQTACREAQEEAGIDVRELEQVAGYYPSPGAFSEYIVSFVGITSLAADHEQVHGVATEHEDIRSFVVPFSSLMRAVESGEANIGPLVLSALWLNQNRARLRTTCGDA